MNTGIGVPGLPMGTPRHATVLIARVARVVRSRFEQALKPIGLRQRHVVALSYLRGHGPSSQQALAERLCMDASSLVCLLNDLEHDGLIVRRRDPIDRRRGVIEITERGERALQDVDRALDSVEDDVLGLLDRDDRRMLHGLLARLGAGARPSWSVDD
jgi:DNA-binding MarR family transcriptional regulator